MKFPIYLPPTESIQLGDIVVFRGGGLVFELLSRLIKLFVPHWDRWGWHMAFVSQVNPTIICESEAQGVHENPLPPTAIVRIYRWLPSPVDPNKVAAFVATHRGKQYDVVIYFWTTLQYLIRHVYNRRIPRLLDDRYTCWELASEFCDDLDKSWESRYDCPLLTDFLTAVGEI